MITPIIIATAISVYLLQILSVHVFKIDYIASLLAFRTGSFMEGHWWQMLTYGWIHSVEMPIHILFNMLTVHFIGRDLEWSLGAKRYLILYGWGLMGAVFFWYICEPKIVRHLETLAGASGAVFALFGALAALRPKRSIQVLLFFVIPVKGQVRWFFLGAMLFEILCWKMGWLSFIAHMAHVGGGLVGWGLGKMWRPRLNFFGI